MKVVAIIQARIGSTRLSGKIMKELCGKTVLEHVINRVKLARNIDEIIIATTIEENDDIVEKEAKKCGVTVFRGSEENVLSRYYFAAQRANADVVVRITSDCPLIDPEVTGDVINYYLEHNLDIVTNGGIDLKERTYPRGLDTEVFSYNQLENAYLKATKQYQREHVTPYIYENSTKVFYFKNNTDYSYYRWTLDTPEDYKLIKCIYERLYSGHHNFRWKDVLKLFDEDPSLFEINCNIEQKKLSID